MKRIVAAILVPILLLAALPATDTFTNTNGTALATHNACWTVAEGSIDIQSNEANQTAGGTNSTAYWNCDTFPDDQAIKAVYRGDGYSGPTSRHTAAASYYGCFGLLSTPSHMYLYRGGSLLASNTSITLVAGDTIKITSIGSVHTCYVNDVTVGVSATDATHATGAGGIFLAVAGAKLDNWEGGAAAATAVRHRVITQ